jgi:hypothetical protein
MPTLLKHGEFVAPEVIALGDKERSDPNPEALHGTLRQFSKSQRATDNASAMGMVSAVYENAVQLVEAAASVQTRGLALMFVFYAVGTLAWLAPMLYVDILDAVRSGSTYFFVVLVGVILFLSFFVPPLVKAAWRADMFSAEDQPTIFDRKYKRIYRLFSPLDGSANNGVNRFKPIELQAVEYDWNHVAAEHRVELVTSGQTVSRIHRLVMIARDRPKPGEKQGRLLEEFNVGNSMGLGENSVPMLWEHIRRYMEEGGPAIPQDEPLQVFERPKTLWQSFGVVGPLGPRFMYWWREHRFLTLFVFASLPFSLPFLTVWGICNWISHKTMRKTVWPDEVHRRIGKPIRTV